jgi:hypothetical protein
MTDVDTMWCRNFVQNRDEKFLIHFLSNSSVYTNYIDFDDAEDNSHPIVLDDNCCLVAVENYIHPADVRENSHLVDFAVVGRVFVGTVVVGRIVVGTVVVGVDIDRIVVNSLNDE